VPLLDARVGSQQPKLNPPHAAETAPRVGEFSPQDLANTAWSFAVADTLSSARRYLASFCTRHSHTLCARLPALGKRNELWRRVTIISYTQTKLYPPLSLFSNTSFLHPPFSHTLRQPALCRRNG
jgi:hypothetical protein